MTTRKPALAFFLSFVFHGLGQFYIGKAKLAFLIVAFDGLLFSLIMAFYGYGILSYESFKGITIVTQLSLSLIYAVYAATQARRIQKYEAKKYNRLKFYFGFVILYAFSLSVIRQIDNRIFTWPFFMSNNSMPMLAPLGTCVLVRLPLGKRPIKGALVVWKYEKSYFISKVTGTPGDSIPMHLENNQYFLEAEEPGHMDSTRIGPVSENQIMGIVQDVIKPYVTEGLLAKINILHCIGERL